MFHGEGGLIPNRFKALLTEIQNCKKFDSARVYGKVKGVLCRSNISRIFPCKCSSANTPLQNSAMHTKRFLDIWRVVRTCMVGHKTELLPENARQFRSFIDCNDRIYIANGMWVDIIISCTIVFLHTEMHHAGFCFACFIRMTKYLYLLSSELGYIIGV